MNRLAEKLLATLLSLLLVLAPMQAVFAGSFSSVVPQENAHQMHDMHADINVDGDFVKNTDCDCSEACNQNGGCNAHNCSSGHCVFYTPGILSGSFAYQHLTAVKNHYSSNPGIITPYSADLFRPPIA